jgi:hypothetical protein
MVLGTRTYAQPVADPLAPLEQAETGETTLPAERPVLSLEDAGRLTNWVIATRDNGEMPFIVIDKNVAMIFAFDAQGRLLGAAPALLGITPGDESAPGVGDRELSNIPLEQRTTPAGRFVATVGPAPGHDSVLWIDFASALSLHAVVRGTSKERRLQRLKSRTPGDNRVTYGCINVPASFYGEVVRPLFGKMAGIVYILPESKPLSEVFTAL